VPSASVLAALTAIWPSVASRCGLALPGETLSVVQPDCMVSGDTAAHQHSCQVKESDRATIAVPAKVMLFCLSSHFFLS